MNQRIQELVEQAGGSIGTGLEFAVVFGELEDFEKIHPVACAGMCRSCTL
jgi:hypothetical protein